MSSLNSDFNKALKTLGSRLENSIYCIRGTCSLVLQGIDMKVDDIDVLCNKKTALEANELFKEYIVEPVSFKESDKFKSYFGKFNIDGIPVEFMGDWQIKDNKSIWSKIYDGSSYNNVMLDGIALKVSKIEDELNMFLAMGRFNAYHKIKKQLQSTDITSSIQPTLFS